MYNFIFSAFADEIDRDIDIQMDELDKSGVKFIELRTVNGKNISDWDPKEFREIAKKMKDRGFGASSIGSPIGKIGITDDFGPHLDKFKNTLDIAAEAGAKYIRMFSFYMPQDKCAEYRDAVLERWNRFIEAAKGYDVILAHENEGGIYGESPANALDLVKTLNTPKVRNIFDPANYAIHGHETIPAFDSLIDYTCYFHIKDAKTAERKVVPSGEGDGNLPYIVRELKKREFNGFLTLEPHLMTGDIAVGGADLFRVAFNAINKVIAEN